MSILRIARGGRVFEVPPAVALAFRDAFHRAERTEDKLALIECAQDEGELSEQVIGEMLARATDGRDHEWGWYAEDVPRLIAALRAARD